MKSALFSRRLSTLMVCLATFCVLPLEAQQSGQTANPNQIALLRWYPANRVTQVAVGNIPSGVAFDGEHLWVTVFDNTVVKLRPSDGAIVGRFPLPGNPSDVAFDGANVWVTIPQLNLVSKLRARDALIWAISRSETSLGAWLLTAAISGW